MLSKQRLLIYADGHTDMKDPSPQEATCDFEMCYDPFPGQMYYLHGFCFETYEN